MSDLIWLSKAQVRRIEPCFPLSHGVSRVDDRRVVSGIIFAIRNGLRWRGVPTEHGPPKTIHIRFIRWSRMGVFNKIFAGLAAKGGKPDRPVIDATHPKAQRNHVRQAHGLAAHPHPLPSLHPNLHVRHLHRSKRHLLAWSTSP